MRVCIGQNFQHVGLETQFLAGVELSAEKLGLEASLIYRGLHVPVTATCENVLGLAFLSEAHGIVLVHFANSFILSEDSYALNKMSQYIEASCIESNVNIRIVSYLYALLPDPKVDLKLGCTIISSIDDIFFELEFLERKSFNSQQMLTASRVLERFLFTSN